MKVGRKIRRQTPFKISSMSLEDEASMVTLATMVLGSTVQRVGGLMKATKRPWPWS